MKRTIILSLLFLAGALQADEIILKEGRTLQGTITAEDDHEYTLYMASKMFLRVDKTKVSKVVRTAPVKKIAPQFGWTRLGKVPLPTQQQPTPPQHLLQRRLLPWKRCKSNRAFKLS